jgi:hypothetical protein
VAVAVAVVLQLVVVLLAAQVHFQLLVATL